MHIIETFSQVIITILYFLGLYLLGIWIFQDAQRRGLSGYLWAVLIVFFPIPALPIYIIVRLKYKLIPCPDCSLIREKDYLLCYRCPYNPTPQKFSLLFLLSVLSQELVLNVVKSSKFFVFSLFNQFYEAFYLANTFGRKKLLRLFWKEYLFKNPWTVARRFRKKFPDLWASLIYGETPFSTVEKICKHIKITPKDTLYELGAGRGTFSLWVALNYGIPVKAFELIEEFVKIGNKIKEKMELNNLEFEAKDFFEADFSKGTIFYITGTTFPRDVVSKLCDKLRLAPSGSHIITTTYALNLPFLVVKKEIEVFLSWGWEKVYIHEKYC